MSNIEGKLKKILAERGITLKSLANEVNITEQGLGKMLRNNSMKVETLSKISEAVKVSPSYWFEDETNVSHQTASGTGNVIGSGNKHKVEVGSQVRGRQEVYGRRIDEILMELMKCEKEREIFRTEKESFARELDIVKSLLAAKDEMIAVLRGR